MALKQVIVRLAPITNSPVIFYADSRSEGQVTGVMEGQERRLGIDYYAATEPVDVTTAHKIVQAYAKQANIPETDIIVRSRLPKTNTKPRQRRLDDANLVLVKSESKAEQPKQEDNMTSIAQAMQDAHDKEKKGAKFEQKASANNPQGATVKRTEDEKKTRRSYVKKDKERSAKSKAAYERYVKEIQATAAQSPTFMEPAVAGPGVTKEEIDDATMQFALKLAKLLKGVM